MATKSSIDDLNKLLRGEISAVETYRMALDKLDRNSAARGELEMCMGSHQDRVAMLRDAVMKCGGEPATGSGPWGMFAKAVEGGAKVFGDAAAIAALEQGEDHGLKDYNADLQLDTEARMLVKGRLLPLQQRTHDRISALKRTLS